MFSSKSDNLLLAGNKYSINELYDLLISIHEFLKDEKRGRPEVVKAHKDFLLEIHKGLPELASLSDLLESINRSKLIPDDKYLLKQRINSRPLKMYLSIFTNPQKDDFLSVTTYTDNIFETTPLLNSKLGQQSKEIIFKLSKV
jgi:hypothetical protein